MSRVEPGSPAEKAGLLGGDIIVRFDGKTIEKSVDLPRAVGDTKPGTKSIVTVLLKGATRDIPITVAELEPDTKRADKTPEPPKPVVANGLGPVGRRRAGRPEEADEPAVRRAGRERSRGRP